MVKRFTTLSVWLIGIGLIVGLTAPLLAQTIVTGDVAGTVVDASGAVMPAVNLTLTSPETGATQNATTSDTGTFRFALLRPGQYNLTVTASGFAILKQTVTVAVGQVTPVNVKMTVKAVAETVEVTGAAPLLATETANIATDFSRTQVELLPNPGQDLTSYAFNAPGVVLSTGAGYGNFSAFGLGGTANLYTVNGADNMDPYLNLNNSGASNNLLGANEVDELVVVANGYTGQYGRQASVNVNYTTRSGSNAFHGNARWDWNGRYLNANEWFTKQSGAPIGFMNSNQWGGSFGGPIIKNKLFFFFDSEGLRYVLPGAAGSPVFVPSPAFESQVLASLPANEVSFYQNMFNLYNGASGISRATPTADGAGGCGDYAGTAGFGDPGAGLTPCSLQFRSLNTNLNTERLMAITVDWVATDNDKVKFRYWQDRGVQATGTDPINSAFNANSVQPQDTGQVNWNHVFSPRLVNEMIASGSYYSAIFGPQNIQAALATFPTTFDFADGSMTSMGGTDWNFPQGRKVAQYQIVDDLSWTKGNHALKFGVNFRRNNISTFTAGVLTSGDVVFASMTSFVNGVLDPAAGDSLTKRFANATHQPIAVYSIGLYGQDEFRVTPNLKLTMTLRADRNSNETCRHNCFSRFAGDFADTSHNLAVPYNASISNTNSTAFPAIERMAWQPRFGFSWNPHGGKNVLRGGIGIFSDLFPGFLADRFVTNFPNVSSFTTPCSACAAAPVVPGVPGGAFAQAAAAAAAVPAGFAAGFTLQDFKNAVAPLPFSAPNFNSVTQHLLNPKYVEWNLEWERQIGGLTMFSLNYVGNHGSNIFLPAPQNLFCSAAKCPNGFAGLPSAAPDPRFSIVTEVTNGGVSNYNGLVASLTRKLTKGFTGGFHYTWSHALDDVSNGGLLPYYFDSFGNRSILLQINPLNPRFNYSNADYDFRHTISANYLWQLPFKSSNGFLDKVLGGWNVAGTVYWRSAVPFSVFDTHISSSVISNGRSRGAYVMGDFLGGPIGPCGYGTDQCFTADQFNLAQTDFGNTRRNQFRGPRYFDTDMTIVKDFRIHERFTFSLGANAYNLFNHPNFGQPDENIADGTFGGILATVVPPSSPYGNFQGGVFGRVLQTELKFKF